MRWPPTGVPSTSAARPSDVSAVDPSAGSVRWAKVVSGGSVHALLATNGVLYVGGLFETYDGVTQHGLVEVNTEQRIDDHRRSRRYSARTLTPTPRPATPPTTARTRSRCRSDRTPARSSSAAAATPRRSESSNETILMNATTGARLWKFSTIGDSQADRLGRRHGGRRLPQQRQQHDVRAVLRRAAGGLERHADLVGSADHRTVAEQERGRRQRRRAGDVRRPDHRTRSTSVAISSSGTA